jgi:tRNA threonylcarbamoyladenosine biosynthesis protein TsaB
MILALDTCSALGGVALGKLPSPDEPHPEVLYRELAGRTFSELLLTTISALLDEAQATLSQLAAVVVVHGPGSFTGIRIGVSAAKGFAEALSIPVIAVSRLALLARKTSETDVIAVLDAGRSEFYVGIYRAGVREAELLLTREELLQAAASHELPLVVCEEQVFAAVNEAHPQLVAAPTAVDALAVGVERLRAGLVDDVATLDANYLRRSDAEILARLAAQAAARAEAPPKCFPQ